MKKDSYDIIRSKVLSTRYLLPGETEPEMYIRVAKAIIGGEPEEWGPYGQLMHDGIFLPNTPTLVNAGTTKPGGFSACYVVPVEDSLDGIYQSLHHAAIIHKAFGGTGFNFSSIRPKGSLIQSTGGQSCGPVKVMHLFNESAGVIRQGGIREGANMGILNSTHDDIHEFIHCKEDGQSFSHFNISVGFEDKPDEELLGEIASAAWKTGCPGVVFLDMINVDNPTPKLGKIDATNPCSEQPLLPYESCNLGSINLSKFVEGDAINLSRLGYAVRSAVRFLDAVIDKNQYPLERVRTATLTTRKIGLGVMGWADLLILLGIPYCSEDALTTIDEIGGVLRNVAIEESVELGKEKGYYPDYYEHGGFQRRNASLLTIAPTGSLHKLARCSSGIEPIYDWETTVTIEAGTFTIEHPLKSLAADRDLLGDIAHNIPWLWHLRHQARWQSWIDNGVSKTINLPSSATPEDVYQIYNQAYKMGCKGVTIYRDGSKSAQVLSSATTTTTGERLLANHPDQRPVTVGTRYPAYSGCGKLRVECDCLIESPTVPYEVVILTSGGCKANNEFTGKLISKYIHDPRLLGDELTTVSRICDTAHRVECSTAMRNPKSEGKSCPDIIAKRMEAVWLKKEVRAGKDTPTCPDCGNVLEFGSGCSKGSCPVCGWSGCT